MIGAEHVLEGRLRVGVRDHLAGADAVAVLELDPPHPSVVGQDPGHAAAEDELSPARSMPSTSASASDWKPPSGKKHPSR